MKKMVSEKTLNKRYGIIYEFCKKYREELTDYASAVAEYLDIAKFEDYKKFSNELSLDAFVGNYLISLTNSVTVNKYKKILNNEIMLMDYFNEETERILFITYEEILEDLGKIAIVLKK